MGTPHWQNESFVNISQFKLFKLLDILLQDEDISVDDINFQQNLSFSIQPQELSKLDIYDDQIHIKSNLANILGLNGPLPDIYNEMILDARRDNNLTLIEFLDIFHTRLIRIAYHIYQQLSSSQITNAVLHFSPLQLQNLHLNELFFKGTKTLNGLKQLLQEYFHAPISIHPYKGGYVYPNSSTLNQLGIRYTTLGKNCLLGHRYYEPDLYCEIIIGPLDYDIFFNLWKNHLDELKRLCFVYMPFFITPQFLFKVKKHKASLSILNCNLFLGINTWLLSRSEDISAFEVYLSS